MNQAPKKGVYVLTELAMSQVVLVVAPVVVAGVPSCGGGCSWPQRNNKGAATRSLTVGWVSFSGLGFVRISFDSLGELP